MAKPTTDKSITESAQEAVAILKVIREILESHEKRLKAIEKHTESAATVGLCVRNAD